MDSNGDLHEYWAQAMPCHRQGDCHAIVGHDCWVLVESGFEWGDPDLGYPVARVRTRGASAHRIGEWVASKPHLGNLGLNTAGRAVWRWLGRLDHADLAGYAIAIQAGLRCFNESLRAMAKVAAIMTGGFVVDGTAGGGGWEPRDLHIEFHLVVYGENRLCKGGSTGPCDSD